MNSTHRPNGWDPSYFVDDEFSFKATTATLIQRDFHGVLNVAHLVAAHLILDVQTHHWKWHKNRYKLRRNGHEDEHTKGANAGISYSYNILSLKVNRAREHFQKTTSKVSIYYKSALHLAFVLQFPHIWVVSGTIFNHKHNTHAALLVICCSKDWDFTMI